MLEEMKFSFPEFPVKITVTVVASQSGRGRGPIFSGSFNSPFCTCACEASRSSRTRSMDISRRPRSYPSRSSLCTTNTRTPGREHVTLEIESIDRMYLNVYVLQLQREGGVASFFGFIADTGLPPAC